MADLIAQFLEHLNAERALSPIRSCPRDSICANSANTNPPNRWGALPLRYGHSLRAAWPATPRLEPPADNWPLYAPSMNSVSSKALSRELYRARHTRQEEKQVWDTEHKMD